MKILVFGGSFDPPHKSHLAMLRSALKRLRPQRAYVVPTFETPLKDPAAARAADRLTMTRLALREGLHESERTRVSVSTFELDRGRMTFAFETLRHFARKHPGAELYFLLGSDTALQFRKWKRTMEIRAVCRFLIGRRPHAPLSGETLGLPQYTILPGTFPDISSTQVRAHLLAGETASTWVPAPVKKMIARNGLYGGRIHKRLQKTLSPARYGHTISVARMAVELATRHDIDPEKAALAGVLHDCGRGVPVEDMARFVEDNRLDVPLGTQIAHHQPLLFHAHISEFIARTEYGVADAAVLSAIRKHTLGDLYMSPLDRLIYTADACSRDRRFPEASAIRRKARIDLDDGFRETVRMKLLSSLRGDRWLHSSGISLWNKVLETR